MTDTSVSPAKHGMSYGVILGLIMILIGVVMYVTGMQLEGQQWPQYLYYLIFPAVIIIAIKAFKTKNGGFLSLGEALKTGLVIAIISAIVFILYGVIFNTLIDPEYNDQLMEAVRDNLLENPNMTEDQIEASMKFVENMSNPLIGSSIWIGLSLFFGLIYSLIGGLVMKNERPE